MKKRRQVLAVTLAATMVMGMGLSTVSAYAKDKGGKTKITFTYRDDGSDQSVAPLYQWVTAAYDSWDKKDEVELDVAPITASEGDYFTKIALQLADKGTCPDLVCEDTFQLPNDVAAGYLTDLTDYVKDYDDWNDGKYYDSMKDMVSVDEYRMHFHTAQIHEAFGITKKYMKKQVFLMKTMSGNQKHGRIFWMHVRQSKRNAQM